MNEASEQYSEDIILSINRNMGKRDAGFLYKHQKGITGGVPTDRNAFDPTYVLRMAAGGQKVLTLDSNCLDDQTWHFGTFRGQVYLGWNYNTFKSHRDRAGTEGVIEITLETG